MEGILNRVGRGPCWAFSTVPQHDATMKLNLITPCSRPRNLVAIAKSLRFRSLHVKWRIILDSAKCPGVDHTTLCPELMPLVSENVGIVICKLPMDVPGHFGNAQRNYALEQIAEGDELVSFLDDDTRLLEDFEDTVTQAVEEHPGALGFVFAQQDVHGRVRVAVSDGASFIEHLPGYPRGTPACDTGQMVFKRELIGDARWDALQAADGRFYNTVVFEKGNASRVRWLNRIASVYNALRQH